MIKLKEILFESVITEIDENTTLYHRSENKLEPGDKLIPQKNHEGKHWLEGSMFEVALDTIRKEKYSNRPSRFNCIYSSIIPRSRFVDKGYLYAVKPTGNIFMANSRLIDYMSQKFEREFYNETSERIEDMKNQYKRTKDGGIFEQFLDYGSANRYWESAKGARREDLEVLSDGAIVIEEIQETEKAAPFRAGDNVIVIESGKIFAMLNFYEDDEKKPTSKEFVDRVARNLFDADAKVEMHQSYADLRGTLKKGTKLKISELKSAIYDLPSERPKGKYSTMLADFYLGGKLYERRKNLNFRFWIGASVQKSGEDFARYLKKV